eukprot:CAMPEP_0183316478 /NCGR_PEP_ID=MMETSP0160_2-20130417/55059_1 /TAXON_ID=2839 ORGANISM="Odontella Sinensis, Strain Grunow 1884" /NCGR_SAMPLE_ID=MMETSP0160_2 /ASSEMBLY_ACC=CAM_ASM_000250 /LENGTH=57 /DNA_ID=CAMNT_0025482283 /DNA_START=171 /DNA_END=341 /DNA_ORIENTATION=-
MGIPVAIIRMHEKLEDQQDETEEIKLNDTSYNYLGLPNDVKVDLVLGVEKIFSLSGG